MLLSAGEAGCPGSRAWAWRTNIDGTASLNDQVHAATIDANGDVVAVGVTQNGGASSDFTVVKLSGATGAKIWRRVISGTAATPDGEGRAVAVDSGGNVVAAGFISNPNSLRDFTVVKLAGSDGAELWRRVIDGTASLNDLSRSVRLDAADNVVAGGEINNTATGMDFAVVKLSGATGAVLWRRVIDGSASLDDLARSVRVDPAGDVVAGGELRNTASTDLFVVKLAGASGAEIWRRVIDGTAGGNDESRSVRIDPVGDVVAAGALVNTGTGKDFAVVKLSGATGAEIWRRVVNGTASVDDLVRSVRVDAAGDVVAAGELQNIGSGIDLAVIKLAGGTGAEVWRRVINGTASGKDAAHAVRVDATGDILAAGALQNAGTDLDFTVVKLSGADGSEVWRREINGTASGPDQASALSEDATGDVVAAGFTQNTRTSMDFTVVKLRGTDGSDFVGPPTSVTTTTLPAPSCFSMEACQLALSAALPAPDTASNTKSRRVARKLARLDRRLNRLIDHAAGSKIKKQQRLYKGARTVLTHLFAASQVADSLGTLGVPLADIAQAVSGILALIPV